MQGGETAMLQHLIMSQWSFLHAASMYESSSLCSYCQFQAVVVGTKDVWEDLCIYDHDADISCLTPYKFPCPNSSLIYQSELVSVITS